ncbi:hypothetical protein ACLBOM_37365 [Escherichia coli]
MLMFLAIFPSLRPQYDSVKWLLDRDRIDPVMVMSITASTWHRDKSRMQRNLTLLKKSLQGWGITDVTGIFGDPIRAWVSTLPAVSSYSGPNLLFAPLTEALRFLPAASLQPLGKRQFCGHHTGRQALCDTAGQLTAGKTHGNDFWLPRHREIRAGQQYSAGHAGKQQHRSALYGLYRQRLYRPGGL